MKLVFIRHGDPDYEHDSLTATGFREAELLVPRVEQIKGDYFFVSPLGRAQATAKPSMEHLGVKPETLEWLEEFRGRCVKPNEGIRGICWDWLPVDWTTQPVFYDKDHWTEAGAFQGENVEAEFRHVSTCLDALLKEHGYERTGNMYRVLRPNHDTLVFFCHFGLISAVTAHLLGMSPMIPWHTFAAAPASVTTFISEERAEGQALFRMTGFGDVSHIYAAGEEPSFSARFCECYTDDTRH